jgi:hypothetical protein
MLCEEWIKYLNSWASGEKLRKLASAHDLCIPEPETILMSPKGYDLYCKARSQFGHVTFDHKVSIDDSLDHDEVIFCLP